MGDTPPKRRRKLATPGRPSTLPLPGNPAVQALGGERRAPKRTPKQLGEYKILRLLGEGAMGRVYEAEQKSLGRRVALKVLPDDFARDPQAVERFEREARSAAALSHPNVVRVYGSGVQDGIYYYAMEHVQGRSLRQVVIDREEPVAERVIAKYVLQVALAVDYAHNQGVIHRDLKPDNILVRDEDDQALVADFGLSRAERLKTITQVGALMGTPNYMAPEQTLGRKIDHRIDVYGLGATFYECLTGELPFVHVELRELLRMIKQQPPRPIRELRPDVSADLEAICQKAMEKRPADRYGSAKELADDLIRYMRGDVALARQPKRWQVAARQARKHPAVVALAAALALVVLVSVVWIWSVSSRDTERAEQLLSQARALAGDPLQRYRDEAARLEQARAAAGRAESGGEPLNRSLLAFREAEAALLESQHGEASPADRVLELLNEVRAVLDPDDPRVKQAQELAGELVRAQWRRAERRGETELAAAHERELTELGALKGAQTSKAQLSVTSEPSGARVTLHAVGTNADGVWELEQAQDLGATPVVPGLAVEPGEYVAVLEAPGRVPVRVPLLVGGLASEKVELHTVLPPAEGIPPDFVYVAAGEVQVGGDPNAVRPLYQQREPEWVEGFFLGRYEVTVAEYLEYVRAQPPAERRRCVQPGLQIVVENSGEAHAVPGTLRQAVVGVTRANARAYCRWRTLRDGIPFRLPTDPEWEKAARGPAGRAFPWGNRFDPRAAAPLAALHLAPANGPLRVADVGSSRSDRSIYGIDDMGGNVSEWVEGSFGGDPRFQVLRGGAWTRDPEVVRSASREPVDSNDRADFARVSNRVGFRLAFDLR